MVVEGALGSSISAQKSIENWRYKHATVSISGIATVKLLLSKIRSEIVICGTIPGENLCQNNIIVNEKLNYSHFVCRRAGPVESMWIGRKATLLRLLVALKLFSHFYSHGGLERSFSASAEAILWQANCPTGIQIESCCGSTLPPGQLLTSKTLERVKGSKSELQDFHPIDPQSDINV